VKTHLKHEFALLKSTIIDDDDSWRSWWLLNKERFKHIYHIAQVLLGMAPTEAAGNLQHPHTNTHTHTHTHTHIYAC
jgi:hypothetical protein